jgi:hypothetical protein
LPRVARARAERRTFAHASEWEKVPG